MKRTNVSLILLCFVWGTVLAQGSSVESSLTEDGSKALREHLALAAKYPADFGFSNADEARSARLGWAYPYYSLEEWSSLIKKPLQAIAAETDVPPRRLIEVLGADKTPRCVFIQARLKNGQWGPGVLGFRNLAGDLTNLARHPRRSYFVLLVDPNTRRLYFADKTNPDKYFRLGEK